MSYEELPKEFDLPVKHMSWLVARFTESWSKNVKNLRREIENQRPNEVDYIYSEVKDQVNRVLFKNETPEEAIIEVYGARIRKVIVHHKTEKSNGADVYLEVDGAKFALTQFKLQNGGRYNFDNGQLENLRKWCQYCIPYHGYLWSCPSFVWLIDDSGYYVKHRILRVCKVLEILNGRKSASIREFDRFGITRNSFKELLAKCWVGASFTKKPSQNFLREYSAITNRLVVSFTIGF